MKKKVLVTGGGGYIGTHVVRALLNNNFEVYVADLNYNQHDARIHVIDTPIFSGESAIFDQVGSPDVLIHLAWQNGFKHAEPSHIENIPKHYTFIKNMIEGGLKQIVGMGTVHEIGYYEGSIDETTPANPQSCYGIAKNSLRQLTEVLAGNNKVTFQWARGYYIVGDDNRSQSVFRKILDAEQRGDKLFPFTSGKNKYDFIDVKDLARQIVAIASQREIAGIINCCSGIPTTLADRVEQFITDNKLRIRLNYGAFPDRSYDSPAVWGNNAKITQILVNAKKSQAKIKAKLS